MESSTKQPKISVDEFKNLVRTLPELREGISDLPKLARKINAEKLAKIFDQNCVWSELYELPFEEVLAWFICCIGKLNELLEAAKAANPTREFLNRARQWDIEKDIDLPEGIEEKHVVLLTYRAPSRSAVNPATIA
jgi:hypothetical protein